MSLIKSIKPKLAPLPSQPVENQPVEVALEDIDYVLGAQRASELYYSLESDQTDLLHAQDVLASLENLEQVLESMQELDVIDAALIEVVGNVAGATSNAPAEYFTPSMEAVDDNAPNMATRMKAIMDKILAALALIFKKIRAYISYIFSSSRMLAKNFESLQDKIREYNFTTVQPITIKDILNCKGKQGVISGASRLKALAEQIVKFTPEIFTNQIEFFYDAYKKDDVKESVYLNALAHNGRAAAHAISTSYPIKINGVEFVSHVFESASDMEQKEVVKGVFSTYVGLQSDSEKHTPNSSTFEIDRKWVEDVVAHLEPLVMMLSDQKGEKGFVQALESMSKEIEKVQGFIRQKKDSSEKNEKTALLEQTGLALVGTSQLPAFIRSHKILESTTMVFISYLNHCLATSKVKTTFSSSTTHHGEGVIYNASGAVVGSTPAHTTSKLGH